MHIFSVDHKDRDKNGEVQSYYYRYLELFIVVTLSVSVSVIYFNVPRGTRAFGEAGLVALLLWAIYHKRQPVNPIPKYVIITSVLYILSYVVNLFMSPDPQWEHVNIRKYIYIIIGGLLFAFPVKEKYRQFMIISFFSSAAIAGAFGIYQYFKWGLGIRVMGFSGNPLHYAGLLGFVCSTAVLMLFIRKENHFESKWWILFLSIVAVSTFIGILFSLSRGVWVALFIAGISALFLYDIRKAVVFLLCTIAVLSITFYFNARLKETAKSIVTAIDTENENGSTGTRLELSKGALLLFRESPFFGVGTGNFESEIRRLVYAKKLKETPTMVHAHNIFLQALATRGMVGFMITLGLFVAMIKWSLEEIRNYGNDGGYVIILSTMYVVIAGLTENNIEFTKFLTAYSFNIGLFGSLKTLQGNPLASVGVVETNHEIGKRN